LFMKYVGTLSEVTNCVFYAGMLNKGTTPLSANDGVYIEKPTGQAGLLLETIIGGVVTSVAFPSYAVLVAGVQFEIGIEVDYLGNVAGYFNPGTGGPFTAGSVIAHPGRQVQIPAPLAGLSQVALSPSFGILNSTAVARTLTTDYVTVVNSR